MKTSTIVTLIVLAILIILAVVLLPGRNTIDNPSATNGANSGDEVACTMDAMMCPDGSYVGRIPPNCEFAACPDGTVPTPNVPGATGGDFGPAFDK